ncbi:MAG: bifunctional 3-(3-hydroxy-phenyl)propionate/3-hydroxycinnamic acid hydroxylase, partial [Alcaligenaceae bacterium]
TDRGNRVEVVTRTPDDGLKTIEATYVIGCDGGRSVTRRLIDTTFEGTTSPTRWLVIDIANDPLGTPNIYVGADPTRPYVSVAIAHGIRRFEFMVKSDESTEEATSPAYLHERLKDFLPSPDAAEIIRSRVYTHHSRIAGSFHKGRVFLAGDAAHLMPVWQGQGYNSGIRDANNLGWKLAAVINGRAGDRLLDTYDMERRKHVRSMIDLSTTVGRVISPTNRLIAGARDAVLLAASKVPSVKRYIVEMRFKPMPRFETGAVVHSANPKGDNSAVGTLFIQPRVTLRDGTCERLDDVLGTGFSILAWGNSPKNILDKDVADDWLSLGAKLVAVLPVSQLHWNSEEDANVTVVGDVDGKLRAWFDTHTDSVLFIRPDRYIAGACVAQDADALSEQLLAALALRPESSNTAVS